MSTLIIGTGFVGSVLPAWLRRREIEVTQCSRKPGHGDLLVRDGAALDALIASRGFDQIVLLGQLTGPSIDWALERIDGPRWLIMSSQQLVSRVPSPGTTVALAREALALARGACVLRPTMIFGRGGDVNITRLISAMRRWRVAIVPGSGSEMVQPLHVDDLSDLIVQHALQPTAGLYSVGGAEALPLRELVATLAELLGLRLPLVEVPDRVVDLASKLAPLIGLRQDQFKRLSEAKVASNGPVSEAFDWIPEVLGLRLEQAVHQCG